MTRSAAKLLALVANKRLGVFVVSTSLTLTFRLSLPPAWRANESWDYANFYEPVARNILAGEGLELVGGTPATAHPPGYPLMLAGAFWLCETLDLGETLVLALLAGLAMGATSVLLYALAQHLWSPRTALITPLVWMTYPFALWLTKQPNSEIPFLVAFYSAWYLFWVVTLRRHSRPVAYAVCGLLVGIAMLIRPIAIGTGLLLAGLLWFSRRDLRARQRGVLIGALLAGNLVAALPWEVWLYQRTGRLLPVE